MSDTKLTVVRDTTGLFETGDEYSAADIQQWLADDALPEGLVLENGRRMTVHRGELLFDVARGRSRRRRKPSNQSRWVVLLALDEALERGEAPSYRDLRDATDLALGSVSWHLQKLEELGYVQRSRWQRRSTRVTALGHEKAKELRR